MLLTPCLLFTLIDLAQSSHPGVPSSWLLSPTYYSTFAPFLLLKSLFLPS
jgi:hypothetical protein